MRKINKRIWEQIDKPNQRLQRKLESLPPKTKLAIVVSAASLFTLCVMVSLLSTLKHMGSYEHQLEIRHIKTLDLPSGNDSITTHKMYNYESK